MFLDKTTLVYVELFIQLFVFLIYSGLFIVFFRKPGIAIFFIASLISLTLLIVEIPLHNAEINIMPVIHFRLIFRVLAIFEGVLQYCKIGHFRKRILFYLLFIALLLTSAILTQTHLFLRIGIHDSLISILLVLSSSFLIYRKKGAEKLLNSVIAFFLLQFVVILLIRLILNITGHIDNVMTHFTLSIVFISGFLAHVGMAFGLTISILYTLNQKSIELGEMNKYTLWTVGHDLRLPLYSFQKIFDRLDQGDLDIAGLQQFKDSFQAIKPVLIESRNVLNNLQALGMRYQEKVQINWEVVSLQQLITQVLNSLDFMIVEKGISIKTNVDDIALLADPNMITVVLTNLIKNAIEHAAFQGKREVYIFSQVQSKKALISIKNAVNSDFFKHHSQFKKSIKLPFSFKSNGEDRLGIGVKISQFFLTKHHSKITMRSIDKAVVFSFSLDRYRSTRKNNRQLGQWKKEDVQWNE